MSGKVFLDSNILVYAQDTGSADKQRRSRELIARLADSGDGVISTQVMQEFFVAGLPGKHLIRLEAVPF